MQTTIAKVASIVVILAAAISIAAWVDIKLASEPEVVAIHYQEMAKEVFVKQSDVNHIINMMVDEQVGDAENEKRDLEDRQDLGETLTASEIRKISRLEKDITKYKEGYVNE